jgi:exodeoxyribonuclease V alpha subunit
VENNPERLLEVPMISDKILARFMQTMKENGIARDLLKLTAKAGVSLSGETLHALIARYGPDAEKKLRNNPYEPCGTVSGYSFDRADALAISLGYPMDSDNRLVAAICKVLDDAAMSGHVCLPKDDLLAGLVKFTSCSSAKCADAIRKAFREKKLRGANNFIYMPKRYEQEASISQNVLRLILSGGKPITQIDSLIADYEAENVSFAECQRDAIRNVFKYPFSIITGGPGVGKTTVTKCILAVHQLIFGASSEPILIAPTGKASRRMSETTGFPAQTIHSAVGWKGEEFDYDGQEPIMLEGNLIIVDEASMMDQEIACILFERIRSGSRVVLVGDIDQLPSVGCGNVLADLICSEVVPTTRLTVIFRQDEENPIIINAHKINNGDSDLRFGNTFRFVQCRNEEEVFKAACSMYTKCVKAYGDEKVLLLNPQRNNTPISVDRFNAELQSRINPPAIGKMEIKVGKTVFRVGDKVMELKNTEDGPKNGDVGYIRDITRRPDSDDPDTFNYYASIEWNGEDTLIEYSQDDLRHVTLAFCTTVHKSQGSEYQSVIEVVSKAHPSMLRRNLVYTGITRAKVNVCLIGEMDALRMAVANNNQEIRYTLLASRLHTAAFGRKEVQYDKARDA